MIRRSFSCLSPASPRRITHILYSHSVKGGRFRKVSVCASGEATCQLCYNLNVRSIVRSCGQLALALLALFRFADAANQNGPEIYKTHCAQCHETTMGARIPARAALQQLTSEAIQRALTDGVMKEQGSALSKQERVQVAEWLSKFAGKPGACQ